MYVGRIVAVGKNAEGRNCVMYRVSSRSFPNRTAREEAGAAWIVPRPGHEDDVYKNPYIAYRCLRIARGVAIASNGSHTDPVADKIGLGVPVRDALASVLLAMDYEKDDYDTPRVIAAVEAGSDAGFLGVVRRDGIEVRELPLSTDGCYYIATYEIDNIDPSRTDKCPPTTAADAARYVVDGGAFADLDKPITSAAAVEKADGAFEIGTYEE